MKKSLIYGSQWFLLAVIYSSGLQAYLIDPGTCSTSSMAITRIEEPPLNGSNIVHDDPIYATQCFGVNTQGAPGSNDDAGGRSSPRPNIGHLEDGFLNGQPLDDPPTAGLDPYLFIDSPGIDDSPSHSQPTDIPGNASEFDPGWIHLANIQGSGAITYSTVGTGDEALDLADLLTIFWTCGAGGCGSGTWTLETDPNIVEIVQALLGANTFDHLAITVFQANKLAIYDFDFTILTEPGGVLEGKIDFLTPYAYSGTWSMADFGRQSGSFSHVNFWARDPGGSPRIVTEIPGPAPLFLLLAGLVSFFLSLRLRNRK